MRGDFGPEQLKAIDRQIARGERAIEMQKRVLATLRRLGKPTEQAERLLANSALLQRRFIQDRAAIAATIARREGHALRAAERARRRG
ncbi:MAG: hypothetical protein KF889_17530 [Alphaproteobacteria bacterium]|nr:hypothetical protein [Alphaproteobacteria bacterium]MCW5739829.1 hypothetical protein [Alphaproteobacteria bacterium]